MLPRQIALLLPLRRLAAFVLYGIGRAEVALGVSVFIALIIDVEVVLVVFRAENCQVIFVVLYRINITVVLMVN